jgi:hypothetical protein
MSVIAENTFTLNGKTSNFCVKINGGNTVGAIAVIKVRSSQGRDTPGPCGNGFDTTRLPFARGHIIASELGGSDLPQNLVPQFEDWQGKGNGAWRNMETTLSAGHDGKIMHVEIGYGRTGGVQTYATLLASFEADHLMDWFDSRIPDSFRVRVFTSPTCNPSAVTNDVQFDTMSALLCTGAAAYDHTFTLGNSMPQPDRGMYIGQAAASIFEDLVDEPGFAPLVRSLTPVSLLLTQDFVSEVRVRLASVGGVTAAEASGFQAIQGVLALNNITEPKIMTKVKRRRTEGVAMASDADIGKKRSKDNP